MFKIFTKINIIILFLLLFLASFAWSLGYKENQINGNKLYKEGDFEGSLVEFDEGLSKKANFDLYYNRGASFYKLGQYDKALSDFEDAATYSNSTGDQIKALYNGGNSSFMRAESVKEEDPNLGLESYDKAVKHFERVLELDTSIDAAYNLELARLRWDELRKQLEEQEQQEEDGDSENQDSENQEQNEQDSSQDDQQQSQDQNQSEENDTEQQEGQQPDEQDQESSAEEASFGEDVSPEDILNEEARRQEAVQLQISSGSADAVDKDW